MPEDNGPTIDRHQKLLADRMLEFVNFLKSNPKGVTWRQVLKHFLFAKTITGEVYCINESTLYRYLDYLDKAGCIKFEFGKYFWDDEDEVKFE